MIFQLHWVYAGDLKKKCIFSNACAKLSNVTFIPFWLLQLKSLWITIKVINNNSQWNVYCTTVKDCVFIVNNKTKPYNQWQ